MNLFFFGGTFDPPHLGHYYIVKKCLKRCDKIIVIPNKLPVDKVNVTAKSIHRFNMLKILFNNLNVEIDDFELYSKKKNYTFHTIKYLINKYKDAKITMVVGQDQIYKLKNWYRSNEIMNLIDIVCFNRQVKVTESINSSFNLKKIEKFNINISSTQLRKVLKTNNYSQAEKYTHIDVIDYIRKNNLYVR